MKKDTSHSSSKNEKRKSLYDFNLWKPLVQLAVRHRKSFIIVWVLTTLGTGAGLLEPLVYRMAVNDISGLFVHRAIVLDRGPAAPHPDTTQKHALGHIAPRNATQTFSTLIWAALFLFLINVGSRFLTLAADTVGARASNRVEEDFIVKTFRHVLRLPLSFFGQRSSGALAKRIDQSDQVSPIITAFTQEFVPEAISLVGIFAIMVTQNVLLALAAFVTLPLYVVISLRMTRRLESNMSAYYELWEAVSSRIQDSLSAIKTVKLSGAEEREVEQLGAEARSAYGNYLERNSIENRYVFWQSLLINLGQALILCFGGWKVMKHQLTPGDVVMFVSYLDKIYSPVDNLTSLANTLQQNAASVIRALRLLNTGVEEKKGQELLDGPGNVEFQNVHFAYTPRRDVLKGVSMTLEPGKITALVGPSGAGKTTIADLLMRLYEPRSGTITIDGQVMSDIDPSAVRGALGLVAADGAVFRGTLADNIKYKNPQATKEEVQAAARAAGLEKTLERLPKGLATEVGERGIGLSVGERQRLQIARVLLSKPRVLVLDEATANLDYVTESAVKAALDQVRQERTTLVIAHRYSMVKDADAVLVIDNGTIVESGRPHELINTNGWFAQLARSAEEEGSTGVAARKERPAGTGDTTGMDDVAADDEEDLETNEETDEDDE
jgi:ABC-type multidrug transport system fused ATPase/permease subunit